MKWVQFYGSLNILLHCLSLGLEWKLTFSSLMANGEFWKFASILSIALHDCKLMWLCSAHTEIIRQCWPVNTSWYWSWNSNTLATWCKELTHWQRPWCWERLKAGEGDDRGWDGWMASPILWTGVWASSGSWWWTGKPGMLPVHEVTNSGTQLSKWTELNTSFPEADSWRCFARLKTLFTLLLTASPSLFCLLTLVPHCFSLSLSDSINEPCIQTLTRCLETLVCHLLGQLAFQIKS